MPDDDFIAAVDRDLRDRSVDRTRRTPRRVAAPRTSCCRATSRCEKRSGNVYQLDQLPNEEEVLAIAEKWRPFRSLATSYLFASAFDRDADGSVTREIPRGEATAAPVMLPKHDDASSKRAPNRSRVTEPKHG